MIIRHATNADIDRILEINKQNDFPIPKFDNIITQAVIEDESGVIAFGMVKLFAEAILILDHNQPKRSKISAIQLLMLEAIRGSKQHELTQLHAFIKDEHFSDLMKKHYGFENCSGIPLVMNL